MGTVATATKISGLNIAGDLYMAIYSLALDTNDANGCETVDLTSDFSYLYAAVTGDNDTLADNGYVYRAILPAYGTAITSSNVLISVHQSDDAVDPLDTAANATMTTVGALKLIVWGRAAV